MKKTVYKIFTVADVEREVGFLEEMAAAGWRLTKIRLFAYHFEEAEPQTARYALVQKGRAVPAPWQKVYSKFGWDYYQTEEAEAVRPAENETWNGQIKYQLGILACLLSNLSLLFLPHLLDTMTGVRLADPIWVLFYLLIAGMYLVLILASFSLLWKMARAKGV